MRLIDADKLKEETLKKRGLSWESMKHLFCITGEELDNAPTVEPIKQCKYCKHCGNEDYCSNCHSDHSLFEYYERPQGEWVIKGNGTTQYSACSECGHAGDGWDKFCRHCGNPMHTWEESANDE